MNEYVRCIDKGEYRSSLGLGKRYRTVPARPNDPVTSIRIVDDLGDCALYPRRWFAPARVPARPRGTTAKPARRSRRRG